MNIKLGLACHDCTQLIAHGELNEDENGWDADAALLTIEEYRVTITDGYDNFTTEPCSVCYSQLAGSRQTVCMEDTMEFAAI